MDAAGHATDRSRIEALASMVGAEAAQALMTHFGSLREISRARLDELKAIKGISAKRAKLIQSAFAVSRELNREIIADRPLLDEPSKVFDLLREENTAYQVETLQVLQLNTRRRLIGIDRTQGTVDTLLAHSREVFANAITRRASAIILAHNHPSGDPSPSEADIRVTRDLIRCGNLLKIEVLDHVIIGTRTESNPKGYSSLRELGYFYT